jgi:hypothetical protein
MWFIYLKIAVNIAFLALVRYIGKGTAVPCPYIA